MANRTINTNQLTPGTTFMARGKVTWSHIASLIQGKELEERIARERQAGRMGIIDRPHSTISIHEARVVYKNPQAEQNPQLRRIEEKLQAQRHELHRREPDHPAPLGRHHRPRHHRSAGHAGPGRRAGP